MVLGAPIITENLYQPTFESHVKNPMIFEEWEPICRCYHPVLVELDDFCGG
jgi:hypothetical protein